MYCNIIKGNMRRKWNIICISISKALEQYYCALINIFAPENKLVFVYFCKILDIGNIKNDIIMPHRHSKTCQKDPLTSLIVVFLYFQNVFRLLDYLCLSVLTVYLIREGVFLYGHDLQGFNLIQYKSKYLL